MARPGGRARAARRLDLHLHTTASDGRLDPEALLGRCAAAGLDLVAITDHDLPPPVAGGTWSWGGRAVRVIEGAEVSGAWEGRELHLLVYFPGSMPEGFRAFLRERARARARRYDEAVRRVGLPGLAPADEAARNGERAITRLHLARAIVEAGHAADVSEAMRRWTGQRAGLVPLVDLPWAEALAAARAAGGLTSWAHPDPDDARRLVGRFVDLGLQGLEVARPRQGPAIRALLYRLAARHDLVVTGGSDYHGWTGGAPGAFSLGRHDAAAFLRALRLDGLEGPRATG